jgi:hypothetical protein
MFRILTGGVKCDELLKYAQRVASHTLDPMQPPIPQESQMRSSILYNLKVDNVQGLNILSRFG